MTRGEDLVVVGHSTDGTFLIGTPQRDAYDIKVAAAALIDLIEERCPAGRWRSLAATDVESASMWAVKALFNTPPEATTRQ